MIIIETIVLMKISRFIEITYTKKITYIRKLENQSDIKNEEISIQPKNPISNNPISPIGKKGFGN